MLYEYTATITTAADQTATVYAGSPGMKPRGTVEAIKYDPGSGSTQMATGADLTITGEDTGVAILTKLNAGTSVVWFYPRVLVNANTDGSAGSDSFAKISLFEERIKVEVAQGGASKTGTITFYVDEEQ